MSKPVAYLADRAAHATHALLAAGHPASGGQTGPLTAAEVCVYDAPWEALTPGHTAAALREAQKHGLTCHVPGHRMSYWVPTQLAHRLRSDLEARYLADEEAAR